MKINDRRYSVWPLSVVISRRHSNCHACRPSRGCGLYHKRADRKCQSVLVR